jgi:anti-sigma regulatory factor (Ser/Thr protein kinase)
MVINEAGFLSLPIMKEKQINISNALPELEHLARELEMLGEEWELPTKVVFNLNLVLEELITNTIFYGYRDKDAHQILIDFLIENNMIKVTIEDDGVEFNPFLSETPDDLNKPIEDRKIGGLGIHFVKKLMNAYEYRRNNNKNIIILIKHF